MVKYYILLLSCISTLLFGQFRLERKKEISIIASAGLMYVTPLITGKNTLPMDLSTLSNLDKSSLNFLDRSSAGTSNRSLSRVSDAVIGVMAISSTALLLIKRDTKSNWFTKGFILAESIGISTALVNLSKSYMPRYRPQVYSNSTSYIEKLDWAPTKSFFSGHTCLAFTIASSMSQFLPASNSKKYASIAMFGTATAIGYLRLKSGAHFPTDVVTGAAIGTLVGYLIPKMHRSDHPNKIVLSPIPMISGAGLYVAISL